MATRIVPDRAALELAHRMLFLKAPLDELLKQPHFKRILENVARRHMQRRTRFDVKKLQANDYD